jgi:hypothetical protein
LGSALGALIGLSACAAKKETHVYAEPGEKVIVHKNHVHDHDDDDDDGHVKVDVDD